MTNSYQIFSNYWQQADHIFEFLPPPIKQALLSQRQVKYVQDLILKEHTANLGMSSKEVIQVISDIGQASYYVQAENHLD